MGALAAFGAHPGLTTSLDNAPTLQMGTLRQRGGAQVWALRLGSFHSATCPAEGLGLGCQAPGYLAQIVPWSGGMGSSHQELECPPSPPTAWAGGEACAVPLGRGSVWDECSSVHARGFVVDLAPRRAVFLRLFCAPGAVPRLLPHHLIGSRSTCKGEIVLHPV